MDWVIFAVLVALMAAAIKIRRKINEPDSAFGRWYRERVGPKLAQAGKVVMFLTVILWFVIYLAAPEENRGNLSGLFRGLFQSFGGGVIDKDLP